MNRLMTFLGVREGEGRRLVIASTINCLVMFGLYLARAGRDTLFYLEIGSNFLPLMFVANAVFAVFVNEIYAFFVAKYEQHRLYFRTLLVFLVASATILLLVIFRNQIPHSPAAKWILYGGIFATTEAIAVILVVATANFVNELFDLRAIKLLSPYYVSFGHLGSILSGVIAMLFANQIGIHNFFAAWVASLVVVLVVATVTIRLFYGNRPTAVIDATSSGGFLSTSRLIIKIPYLRWFLLVTILNFFLGGAYEWIVARNATVTVSDAIAAEASAGLRPADLSPDVVENEVEARLARYLGLVYIGGGSFALFFQLFFMRSIIRRFGVARANFGAPIALSLGAIGLFFQVESTYVAVVARGSFILAENAFNQTLIRFVYNVLNERERIRVQAFIESNVITITIAATGGFLLLFSLLLVPLPYFAFSVAAAAGGMLWFTYRMKDEYNAEARRNYNRLSTFGREQLLEDLLSSGGDSSNRFIAFLKEANDPNALVHAIKIIARNKLMTHREVFVVGRLNDHWRSVRIAAIQALAEMPDSDAEQHLTRLLKEERDPAVMAALLRCYREVALDQELDLDTFGRFLDEDDPEVLSAAIALLWEKAGMEGPEKVLAKYKALSESDKPEDQILLAHTLGELKKTGDLLKLRFKLLGSDHLGAQIAVISAMGRIPSQQVLEPLFSALHDKRLRKAAQGALSRLASQFPRPILGRFASSSESIERQYLASVVAEIPRQATRQSNDDTLMALCQALTDQRFSVRESAGRALARRVINHSESIGVAWSKISTVFDNACDAVVRIRFSMELLRRQVKATDDIVLVVLCKHAADLCDRLTVHVFDLLTAVFPADNIPTLFRNLKSPRTFSEAVEALENLSLPKRRDFDRIHSLFDGDAFERIVRSSANLPTNEEAAVRSLLAVGDSWMSLCLWHTYRKPPFCEHTNIRPIITEQGIEIAHQT